MALDNTPPPVQMDATSTPLTPGEKGGVVTYQKKAAEFSGTVPRDPDLLYGNSSSGLKLLALSLSMTNPDALPGFDAAVKASATPPGQGPKGTQPAAGQKNTVST
jgi:hypothetical protein